MMKLSKIISNKIFNIQNNLEFNEVAFEIFHYQYQHNKLYKSFTDHICKNIHKINNTIEIPFLPIEFFKTKKITALDSGSSRVFLSSGTTGATRSKHCINDLELYHRSFLKCFSLFYGSPSDYTIFALLPSYLEQESSSLVYMMDALIKRSKNNLSGFFLKNHEELAGKISEALKSEKKDYIVRSNLCPSQLFRKAPVKIEGKRYCYGNRRYERKKKRDHQGRSP